MKQEFICEQTQDSNIYGTSEGGGNSVREAELLYIQLIRRVNTFPFHLRLAQLSGVDMPLFMMRVVPTSPGPCMDTSIFSIRGYRALCLACSLENTALRWLRTSAGDGRRAAAEDAKPVWERGEINRQYFLQEHVITPSHQLVIGITPIQRGPPEGCGIFYVR